MTKISGYVAAWKLQRMVAERKLASEALRQIRAEERGDDRVADYGDNGTEASWMLVDNFR